MNKKNKITVNRVKSSLGGLKPPSKTLNIFATDSMISNQVDIYYSQTTTEILRIETPSSMI